MGCGHVFIDVAFSGSDLSPEVSLPSYSCLARVHNNFGGAPKMRVTFHTARIMFVDALARDGKNVPQLLHGARGSSERKPQCKTTHTPPKHAKKCFNDHLAAVTKHTHAETTRSRDQSVSIFTRVDARTNEWAVLVRCASCKKKHI